MVSLQEEIEIHDLWNYTNPASTRTNFRDLLVNKFTTKEDPIHLILVTQIARTYGLEREYDIGHLLLDDYLRLIEQNNPLVKSYYQLERGRLYNSEGDIEEALNHFYKAWDLAKTSGFDRLAVDAAHMIAIADRENSIEWNIIAIEYAEKAEDERAKLFLGSLYNNQGWTYHDIGQYEEALNHFEKALEFFEDKENENRIRIARWTVGRVFRSLGRKDDALEIMHTLEKEDIDGGDDVDQYVLEELGELYLLDKDEKRSSQYFERAYDSLVRDEVFKNNFPDRLLRIKKLSGN